MIRGKVAIVTGGTRGIGLEIVRKFLQNGGKVALLGSRQETADSAVKTLKKENSNYDIVGFAPNLTNETAVKEVFESVKKMFGKIDILVNNAGISSSTALENYTEAEANSIIDLNIKSVFVCSKVASEFMKENGEGVILNTSSMVSIHAQPRGVLYPASKFAVNGITKSLARELAPFNIRVNAVAPGITETDMVKNLPEYMIKPLIESIPLGRIGKPEDIANAFLFLASDMASYITGTILQVDGCARS